MVSPPEPMPFRMFTSGLATTFPYRSDKAGAGGSSCNVKNEETAQPVPSEQLIQYQAETEVRSSTWTTASFATVKDTDASMDGELRTFKEPEVVVTVAAGSESCVMTIHLAITKPFCSL